MATVQGGYLAYAEALGDGNHRFVRAAQRERRELANQLRHPLDVLGGQVDQLERAVGDGIEKGSLDLGVTMLVEPLAGLGEDRRGQHEGLARHVQVTKKVVGREVVHVPLVRQRDERTGVTDDQRSLPKPCDRVASM